MKINPEAIQRIKDFIEAQYALGEDPADRQIASDIQVLLDFYEKHNKPGVDVAATADQVKKFAQQEGCGLLIAKKVLTRRALRDSLANIRASASLETKIDWLLDRYEESLRA